jgi:hypothetical protein
MSNPLFHIGLGLMSVPNQSDRPGAVSWGPGIQRGLLGYQQSLLYQDEEEERRQRQELQQQKLAFEMQRQQAAQQQAAQRQEMVERLAAAAPPDMQDAIRLNPEAYVKGLLEPQEQAGPAGFKAWLQTNPGGTYEQFLRMKAAIDPASRATQINLPPGPQFRSLPGGGTAYVSPTGDPNKPYQVVPVIEGSPQETPEQKQARQDAAADRAAQRQVQTAADKKEQERDAARKEVMKLGADLEKAAKGGMGAWGTDAANIRRIRNQMAMALAKFRDPGSTIREAERDVALADIPEASGPYDAPRVSKNLRSLYNTMGIDVSEEQLAPAGEGGKPPSAQQIDPSQLDPRVLEILRRQGKL